MIIATCSRGLEEIASKEAKEITGREAGKEGNGLIYVKASWEKAFRLNYMAKTMNRIILLLARGSFTRLEELYKVARNIDYGFIESKQRFAVRFSRHGKHDFTSMDAERIVGQAVIDSYMESYGKRLKVNLEEPDVMIRGFIKENKYWLGIDTTGDSLHKRGYRAYQHPAPLQTTIANALIRMAGWDEKQSLYDPCCGSGTIPIEAYLYGNKVPNKWRWQSFLIWNLSVFEQDRLLEEKLSIDGMERNDELKLYGSDISPKHIEGARKNAARAGAKIKFFVEDVAKTSFDYDIIITNPPYGKRVSSLRAASKINSILEEKILNASCKKAIIFTAEQSNLKNYDRKIPILYGKLWTYAFIYE